MRTTPTYAHPFEHPASTPETKQITVGGGHDVLLNSGYQLNYCVFTTLVPGKLLTNHVQQQRFYTDNTDFEWPHSIPLFVPASQRFDQFAQLAITLCAF